MYHSIRILAAAAALSLASEAAVLVYEFQEKKRVLEAVVGVHNKGQFTLGDSDIPPTPHSLFFVNHFRNTPCHTTTGGLLNVHVKEQVIAVSNFKQNTRHLPHGEIHEIAIILFALSRHFHRLPGVDNYNSWSCT